MVRPPIASDLQVYANPSTAGCSLRFTGSPAPSNTLYQIDLQFLFSRVLFGVSSDPQHPHPNTRFSIVNLL